MRATVKEAGGAVLPYRSDVDGLRAVSIIAVVLYHFGVPYFTGGFVGVDVFFVISGYLITSIILAEIANGAFSFSRFYERRARRILPTLAIVLACTFVASLRIMTPEDFENYSRSMFYTLIFGANMFFDSQGGYFGPNLELAPLLHTWSLSIEEQFYIAWPLVLALTFRYAPKRILPVALALLAASLYANLSLVEMKPVAAFYRPHTRAWELLAGCVLALGIPALRGIAAHAAGVAGLALIGFAVFTFTSKMNFPGMAAVVPVLGAALVIWSGQAAPSLVGRLLGVRPLVFVGLVSYAWYLWHWPMVSLFRYQLERDPSNVEVLALLAASFALAVLCWKLVEVPIRHGAWWKPRLRTAGAAVAACAALMALAGTGYATHGFIDRYPPAVKELARPLLQHRPQDRGCLGTTEDCTLWDASRAGPGVLLWGDSHASSLRTVFRDLGEAADVTVGFAGAAGCPPLLGVGRVRDGADKCAIANTAAGNSIRLNKYTDVILVARWSRYAVDGGRGNEAGPLYLHDEQSQVISFEENRAVIARTLRRTIDAIRATGARAWIMKEAPYVGFDATNRATRAVMRGENPQTLYGSDLAAEQARTAFMKELVAGLPVQMIDPVAGLCDGTRCLAVADGKPLYFDDNHLSIYGAARLAPLLSDLFSQGRKSASLPAVP